MKNKFLYPFHIALLVFMTSSCAYFEIEEVTNPNAADAAVVQSGAALPQIQALVTGLEWRHRAYLETTKNAFGTFGREILPFFDSDPRFTTDWLGRSLPPDAGFFAVANTYNAPYQAIKQGNFLMEAAENTAALNAQQVSGVKGFAKTIQAYQYMVPWLAQWENGIRIEVSDPLNPGPFLSRTEALAAIRRLLDEAANDLRAAGSSFAFDLTDGFNGFDTPAGMLLVNRAIAARAAVYAEDWNGALTALNESFFNLSGNLNAGPAHSYTGADGTGENPFNPFFFPKNLFSTQIIVVHPGVLNALEPGDLRASKFLERSPQNRVNNQALVGYIATHQDDRFATNQSPMVFIKNEELVLLYAEASAQTNNLGQAVGAINAIRSAAGLPAFNSGNRNEILDQILKERRLSLWHEPIGHRWVDLRRYNRLSELERDFIAPNESFFLQLARPQSEVNWDERQGR